VRYKPPIGSKDPHALKIPARRAEYSLTGNARIPFQAEPEQLNHLARKRVEQVFGGLKTVAELRKVRWWGCEKVGWMVTLAAAAYNLVRIRNLMPAAA